MTKSPVRSKRRLLFLLPFPPSFEAAHGGARVIAQLITQLATRHAIAVLYLRAPSELPADSMLQHRCDLVEPVARPEPGFCLTDGWSRIGSLARGLPMWAAGSAIKAYRARVRAVVKTWHPDIVQIEYPVMGQYLSALDGCRAPRVLTEHEPAAKAARDLLKGHRGVGRLGYWIDWLAWQRFERKIVKQVQAVVVFTERDRRELARFGSSTPIVRIPLGTVLPEQSLNPLGSDPLSILFLGSFRHPPNVNAAICLITAILPKVQARYPEIILYIVGDQPPREIRRSESKNIIVTGRVPDVTPYLDNAAVVVVPLRFGGGMRVKVLEALAAGKAVVASPLAAEGLDVLAGEQVMLAETDQQFGEAIVGLLTDPDKRSSLAKRARAWACTNIGWEKSVAAYETLYESLLQRPSIS
jgi:glycosyltransferase involved in cell wall biosynthesis